MNKHLRYLKSFGSERLKEYRHLLKEISIKLGLPYNDEINLSEYLEKYNLWYTLYL